MIFSYSGARLCAVATKNIITKNTNNKCCVFIEYYYILGFNKYCMDKVPDSECNPILINILRDDYLHFTTNFGEVQTCLLSVPPPPLSPPS